VSGEGSRCRGDAAGTRDFGAALRDSPALTDAERDALQRARRAFKGEVGLDEYEVRSWTALRQAQEASPHHTRPAPRIRSVARGSGRGLKAHEAPGNSIGAGFDP
jgi:hypothetical protein